MGVEGCPTKPELERLSPAWKSPAAEFFCGSRSWDPLPFYLRQLQLSSLSSPRQLQVRGRPQAWHSKCLLASMAVGDLPSGTPIPAALPAYTLQPSSGAQPGCSAPCRCPYAPPRPHSKTSPKTAPAPGRARGDEAAWGQGCSSKEGELQPLESTDARYPQSHEAAGSTPSPGHDAAPPCFPLFPIPQAQLHRQFQRFIVWRSCYSTPLSSPWLRLQGGAAPSSPAWHRSVPGSWRLQELQQSENWHLRNPGWGHTLLLGRARGGHVAGHGCGPVPLGWVTPLRASFKNVVQKRHRFWVVTRCSQLRFS